MSFPVLRQTTITYADGSTVTLRGRRCLLVAWLVEAGGYLDALEYETGRLEFNWGAGRLTAQATRFDVVKIPRAES